jgi:hypothetical protein
MPGGLLNIISYGNQNIIINGNPSKTFFKTVYSKYTNFGMQKFRLDYEGQRNLKLNEDTFLTFKVTRNAELLMDAFLVFDLPDIWSPIIPPKIVDETWRPYKFRWISHIGANIIKRMTLNIGGQKIQEFSGEYLKNMVERDFPQTKKDLFYKMIGHTKELYEPENAFKRYNRYPNSFYIPPSETNPNAVNGSVPSISGRTIYVPLHFWFMNSPKMALPLVALQYNEITIDIVLRPIRELFTINDVLIKDVKKLVPIQPNFKIEQHNLYRFLQPPPSVTLEAEEYGNKTNIWNADIHLMTTYGFLTDEESKIFALNEQKYLIKDIKENLYTNITGNNRVRLETTALVSSWLWFFRRSDVYKRNEWSNYSNWDYLNKLPGDVVDAPTVANYIINNQNIGPGVDFTTSKDANNPNLYILTYNNNYICQEYDSIIKNRKEILTNLSIIFDGQLREDSLESGILNYIEKYENSSGNSDDGVYCYNYTLNTSPFELQPSGAINLSKFKTIELDISTILPVIDPNSAFVTICDGEGAVIGTTQGNSLYVYNYDLYFTEERYNLLRFIGGQAGLIYAR